MAGWLSPKDPIPRPVYVTASTLTVGAILAGWLLLAHSGLVRTEFLPTPTQVALAAADLVKDGSLWTHIGASCFVVLVGFGLASVLAVPLGILMGTFQLVEAIDRAGRRLHPLPAGERDRAAPHPVGRHRLRDSGSR